MMMVMMMRPPKTKLAWRRWWTAAREREREGRRQRRSSAVHRGSVRLKKANEGGGKPPGTRMCFDVAAEAFSISWNQMRQWKM